MLDRRSARATSNAGLGETVDERYETTVHLLLDARTLAEALERAEKIDAVDPAARRHPSYWTWEDSIVLPLAKATLDLAETTQGRRKPELANAWRAAWKDILAAPAASTTPKPGAPNGSIFASAYLGYLGRLVPDDEYTRAGLQLDRVKSLDAHVVDFRLADLSSFVLAAILEQAERPAEAKELRALGPVRSLSDLAALRTATSHALAAMNEVDAKMHVLCNVVAPIEVEQDPSVPSPTDVERWLAAIDAARALDVPKLDAIVGSLLTALARAAR